MKKYRFINTNDICDSVCPFQMRNSNIDKFLHDELECNEFTCLGPVCMAWISSKNGKYGVCALIPGINDVGERFFDYRRIVDMERDESDEKECFRFRDMVVKSGLSTEEIESGNVETILKAAPDMLEALEWLSNEFDCRDDEYGMVCFMYDEFRKVKAAIRKARGNENG